MLFTEKLYLCIHNVKETIMAVSNPPHFHVWYDDYKAEITIKNSEAALKIDPLK